MMRLAQRGSAPKLTISVSGSQKLTRRIMSILLMHLPTTNGEHCTGDGLKMSEAIGAEAIDLDWAQAHPAGLLNPTDLDAKIKIPAYHQRRALHRRRHQDGRGDRRNDDRPRMASGASNRSGQDMVIMWARRSEQTRSTSNGFRCIQPSPRSSCCRLLAASGAYGCHSPSAMQVCEGERPPC